jgi:hypothetical protein
MSMTGGCCSGPLKSSRVAVDWQDKMPEFAAVREVVAPGDRLAYKVTTTGIFWTIRRSRLQVKRQGMDTLVFRHGYMLFWFQVGVAAAMPIIGWGIVAAAIAVASQRMGTAG